MVLNDINNREDLILLFDIFYFELLQKKEINYFFTDVVKVNFEAHLPIIVDFWEMTLFQKGGYQKNLLEIHKNIHALSAFNGVHFDIWLDTLNATVNNHFNGPNAHLIKERALSIATIIKIKTSHAQTHSKKQ